MSVLTQFFPAGGSGGIPVELLVLSGGGGGGGGNPLVNCIPGGAGGGGAMFRCFNFPLQPGVTYPITVGAGGAGGPTAPAGGGNGGASCFTVPIDGGNSSICVAGGGGGGYCCTPTSTLFPGSNGGTGGAPSGGQLCGRSIYSTNTSYANPCSVNPTGSFSGYYGTPSISSCGGTGGDNADTRTFTACPTAQTIGSQLFRTYGTDVYLSGGGNAIPNSTSPVGGCRCAKDMPANCGYGGVGGATCAAPNPSGPYGVCPGGAGGSGVVVVKYPSAYGAAPAAPGSTNCSPATPGFYTYRFTSPGSITLP